MSEKFPYSYIKFNVPKGDVKFKGKPEDYQKYEIFEGVFRPNELVEFPVNDRVQWGINIKDAPYTKYYDFMVLQYGKDALPTIGELSNKEGGRLFEIAEDGARIVYDKSDTVLTVISWNTSPFEFQKRMTQSLKRVHVHTFGITSHEIKEDFQVTEITREMRRSVHDPFMRIFGEIIKDEVFVKINNFDKVFTRDTIKNRKDSFPLGIEIGLRNGLNTLSDNDFFEVIQQIHNNIKEAYEKYAKLFLSEEFDVNNRPKLLSKEKIKENIDNFFQKRRASNYVDGFIKKLSSIIKDADGLEKPDWFTKGMSFTSVIYNDKGKDDKWHFVISPRIISGAGSLEVLGIVLNRTTEIKFTDKEIEKQKSFQKELVAYLLKNHKDSIKKQDVRI